MIQRPWSAVRRGGYTLVCLSCVEVSREALRAQRAIWKFILQGKNWTETVSG
jgi:hypothetical protein